jgi:hypothetical protein
MNTKVTAGYTEKAGI